MTIYKTILSHAPKYFTGSVITAFVGLLMIKYYTAVFSPEEFGILALYLVMFKYITTTVSLGMDGGGATRFYFDYRDKNRNEYISTIFWLITIMSFIVLLIGFMSMDIISNWIAPNSGLIYTVTLISAIVAVYVSYFMRILYNEEKSTIILKQTLFQTFINHLSSVVFISILNLGIIGRVSGQGAGYTLNLFTLLKSMFNNKIFKLKIIFNRLMAKETFLLSLPLMITSLQSIIFVYLDRIFIKHYIGDSAVGIYTLGFLLGQGLSMVYEAVSQAILPKVYKDMNENYDNAKHELEIFSYHYYIGLVVLTIIISLLSPLIVDIFSNENYSGASSVIPFVMAGFMMGGFYKIPTLILGYHKKVLIYPIFAFFSFGINALLNWWLIPIYGITGAAFASFVGLYLYSTVMQLFTFRYMSNKYKLFITLGYLAIILISFLLFIYGGKVRPNFRTAT
jgi:O-antigen/teichoic acid export membrane protein